jgi:hypothetical protein
MSDKSLEDPQSGDTKVDIGRGISQSFVKDLKTGVLSPLLARVKEDDTLMLALRGRYINIYYRGGNLFRITESSASESTYDIKFDENYWREWPMRRVEYPSRVGDSSQTALLVSAIPNLKYAMDCFFARHNRPEREFQQLVARENNNSSISNETEYFIVDIELAGALPHAKFDMLAVRWLSHQRSTPAVLVPAIIEMKYGNNALTGDSGLIAHLKDAYSLRRNEGAWQTLELGIQRHLRQLRDLGLLKYNQSSAVPELLLHPTKTPELIFILANYNPRSRAILDILPEFNAILNENEPSGSEKRLFNVRFFRASFAGYGLHHASMLDPGGFCRLAHTLRGGN